MNETEQMLSTLTRAFPKIATMQPLEARAAADSRIRQPPLHSDIASEDLTVPGPAGQIAVRVYGAPGRGSEQSPVVFAHGGGFLHGSIDGHDAFCRAWARRTEHIVVSVDYRLAPEHGAPAGAEDVVAVVDYVSSRYPGKLIVAGDSSGANVAAVAALMLRHHPNVNIAAQVLIYPFLDPEMKSDSHRQFAHGYFVTSENLSMYWSTYLSAPGTSEAEAWQINPMLASDHSGLPPAIVITGGTDPLRDEGRAYAERLRESDVSAIHREYADQFHGFFTLAEYAPAAAAQEVLWADLQMLLAD